MSKVVLVYSKFAKNKARRDGLQSHCKMCRKNIGKQHYQKHKADYRDRGKQWIKENPQNIFGRKGRTFSENSSEKKIIEKFQSQMNIILHQPTNGKKLGN